MSEGAATPDPDAPLLRPVQEKLTGQTASHEETIRRLESELAETRKALAEAEQRLRELRDQRSRTMARLERQAYWVERWGIDLDQCMQRRAMRVPFRALRLVVRLRRRLARRQPG
jgi:septal ring factor EnvC (AmiA/AmiB activator)